MKYTFIEYPKCSTCQKAKKWLEENEIEFEDRHIVEHPPTYEELTEWIQLSGKDVKSFFNTSGLVYKRLNLKEKLPTMSEEEKVKLLTTNGMLVKRPLLVNKENVYIGFKVKEWETLKK